MQMAYMHMVHLPYGNLPHVPLSFWVVQKGSWTPDRVEGERARAPAGGSERGS